MRIRVLLLMLLTILGLQAKESVRQRLNLNREWKFFLGDSVGAEAPAFDDGSWARINLPHNFSMPYFQSAHWYTGYGWYRKNLVVPAGWKTKRIFIEFEGAFRVAEIFVNGKQVGTHQGGYTGFSFDITEQLHEGNNLLAVRLNNLFSRRLAPRNGDHNFTGGIYRDVYLVVTEPVHVTWYGTFVTTPNLSSTSGRVQIQTELRNESTMDRTVTLKTEILESGGKKVASVVTKQHLSPKSTVEFTQLTKPVKNPKLWHPRHPNRYKAVTTVLEGTKVLDTYETPFGFRWMTWTADQGFFLNGEHYYFRGANVHQDHAGWASAITNAAVLRDVRMIKDCGMDFIRGSHYPHDPSFSDACDSLGILLWEENDFWGSGGNQRESDNWYDGSGAYPLNEEDRPGFEESVKSNLKEMIRIHRNHPSIIVWSMCNEPFFTDWRTTSKVRTFLKELTDLTHQLDSTRKVGIGGCQRGEMDKIGDIAGYNGDGARLFINPGIPNVVTEYGSTIAKRPGKYTPGWGDLQKDRFSWRSGEALWCAFDYGTRAGDFGLMGMIDYFRLPKNMYYWYRNEYKKIAPPEPAREGIPARLELTSDKLVLRHTDGTDDAFLVVSVQDAAGKQLSNSPDVNLKIVSGPGEFPTGSSITFSANSDIYIRDGKAAIEFRAYEGGKTVIEASSAGIKSDTIVLETKGLPVWREGLTSRVTERPYTRYVWVKPVVENLPVVNIAFQKPTRASSEAAGKTANLANDKDSLSAWTASAVTPNTWWQVDLENIYVVSEVKVRFPFGDMGDFKIELSKDNQNWDLLAADHAENKTPNRRFLTNNKLVGRFLRISFTNPTTAISIGEVEVFGKPIN